METDLGKEELKISWDMGTAYDFFASLKVLHYPAKFGVRGAWAAGVRSRLSQNDRDRGDVLHRPGRWYGVSGREEVGKNRYRAAKNRGRKCCLFYDLHCCWFQWRWWYGQSGGAAEVHSTSEGEITQ